MVRLGRWLVAAWAMMLVAPAAADSEEEENTIGGVGDVMLTAGDPSIQYVVISPVAHKAASLPISVSVILHLGDGGAAAAVRAEPEAHALCYGLSGAAPVACTDLKRFSAMKSLEAAHVPGGLSRTRTNWVVLGVWLARHGVGSELGAAEVPGTRAEVPFGLRFGPDPARFREERWAAEVGAMTAPYFVEVGTSFFDTLAHLRGREDKWEGLSVEPVRDYVSRLPRRRGLERLAAAVCDVAGSSHVYGVDPARILRDRGLIDDFFAGMNSLDPTHLWRSPELRAFPEKERVFRSLVL